MFVAMLKCKFREKKKEIMKNFDLEALKSALVNPVLFKSTLLTTQEAVP